MERNEPISVLIVDDELFFVELLEHKFQTEGFLTYHAMDVGQARNVLDASDVHVVLLDIMLPGTDGISFLQEIKSRDAWKHIPVILVSNLGGADDIRKGLEAGAAEYLVKAQVDPGEIVSRVRGILAQNTSAH
jgi:DNA-binding response OmpR family regulator